MNGLRYGIKSLNGFIDNVVSTHEGSIGDNTYNRRVPFFIVPNGIQFRNAFEEQQISKDDVALAYDEDQQRIYRYEPSQVHYNPTGSMPVINRPYRESPVSEREQETSVSLRSVLGLAKEEDMRRLLESQKELIKRIEILERRITELEKKIL